MAIILVSILTTFVVIPVLLFVAIIFFYRRNLYI